MSFKEKTGKKVVLVGTYQAGQLERWPGYVSVVRRLKGE